MAGLTCFGTEASSHGQPTGHETKMQVIGDAIRRSEGVVIFYHGLKAFAGDPASCGMIDNMIDEENRYIRLLNRLLDRVRGLSERPAIPALSFAGGGKDAPMFPGRHALEYH